MLGANHREGADAPRGKTLVSAQHRWLRIGVTASAGCDWVARTSPRRPGGLTAKHESTLATR
eukprot:8875022-Lingulodinium_polyedra.AAC.1